MAQSLKNKTLIISGGSRGIGRAIALRAAKDGANVAIMAKTTKSHPKLEGTIYDAADEINKVGGNALPCIVDVRDLNAVQQAVNKTAEQFGGIDILINNASAISLTNTRETDPKRFDLMHQVNTRGTYFCSKYCLPYLERADNPHILNLAPPLNMEPKWFAPHLAYTMAKYGMSLCVLGMSEEFKSLGIGVNALWPKTTIATAAVKNILGGESMCKTSRTPEIMADAAHAILTSQAKDTSGHFFIDEEVLKSRGLSDFSQYKVDPSLSEEELTPDLFV